MIKNLLKNKTAKQKANIKGQEIAKIDFKGVHNNLKNGIKIEITEINAIDGGVEIFVRAWNKNGTQVGFGKNGTVDIERFRIYMQDNGVNNHLSWLVVDDPLGDIVVDYVTRDLDGNVVTEQKRYREDPQQAILDSLMKMIKPKHDGENIISGKIGSTVSSFTSNAGGDGGIQNNGSNWTTVREATTAVSVFDTVAEDWIFVGDLEGATYTISWGALPFDTSALPDTDTIDSATLDVRQGNNSGSGDRAVALIQSTQASNTAIVVADYDQRGGLSSVSEGASRVTMDTADTDFSFTLNSTGLGWIVKTGFTKLGLRGGIDIDGTAPTVRNFTRMTYANDATAANRPTLVVTHSAVSAEPAIFFGSNF